MAQDDNNSRGGKIVGLYGPASFSNHRIITSTMFSAVVHNMTPKLMQSFVPNQQQLMEEFCVSVARDWMAAQEISDLVLETFRMFYGCVAYEMQGARKVFENRVMQEYSTRLTIGYFITDDRILTLMLDMLPNEVLDEPRQLQSFQTLRMTFEPKLNLLH